MPRKLFIIITLGISLIAFMVIPTNAALKTTGILRLLVKNSYDAEFEVTGGDNPHIATFFVGSYLVGNGYLLGVNPQGKDVTVGIAGLAGTEQISPSGDVFIDKNGKQFLPQILKNKLEEFENLDKFLEFWSLEEIWEELLNQNWTPSEILVTWFKIDGEFLTDCLCTDQTDPETCDIESCVIFYGKKIWNCVTDEDVRRWAEDGAVEYVCNIDGYPIAFNDSYSVRQGRTLSVKKPGVLGNDWNEEGDPLTASVEQLPENGMLTLNSDGSFTYTPDDTFTGTDSFTYVANDGYNNSNVATVTITVN